MKIIGSIILFFGIFFIKLVSQNEDKVDDWVLFLGRFHPLIVHLPIGFLLIAYLMELVAFFTKKFNNLTNSTSFILFFAGVSSFVSAILGYLLSKGGGYDEATLDFHKWLGISLGFLTFLCLFIKKKVKIKYTEKIYLFTLTISVVVLSITGHLGGNLTHGSDYLHQYMPNPIRSIIGIPPKVQKKIKQIEKVEDIIVFEDVIQPILEKKCISCHNANKMKGELRLDLPELIIKGGENGSAIVAGNPLASEMFKRITLPKDDELHMPPTGKTPLTSEELEFVEWWIDNQAPFTGNIIPDDRIKSKLEAIYLTSEEQDTPFDMEVTEPNDKVIVELKEKYNIIVAKITEESNLLQVHFLNIFNTKDKIDLKILEPIRDQISWLDLSGTVGKINKNSLSVISEMPHLTKLNLSQSDISLDVLENILKNKKEYLKTVNLFGTNINNEESKIITEKYKPIKFYTNKSIF